MVARRLAWMGPASFCVSIVLCMTGFTPAQEPSKEKSPPTVSATQAGKGPSQAELQDPAKRKALIDKMIAGYDLTPRPSPSIPDNPPPHEGALIDQPYVVAPPDLILVELLEGLPGRPISGERLVRPDGNLSLGWYGDVHVRGLTVAQIKVAIIKHLRKFLSDEMLGLAVSEEVEEEVKVDGPPPERPVLPPLPAQNANPFNLLEVPKPAKTPGGQARPGVQQPVPAGPGNEPAISAIDVSWKIVPPEASLNVFVDVSAYNSMQYYVQGDVAVPGMLLHTGSETVLDALQYADGLLPTADPKQISLVRPQRGGKPAKVYKIDLEGIQERGETATNLQIFSGDRLIVGRSDIVKKTVEIDRLNAPIQAITGTMLQEAFMLRALQLVSVDHRDELLKEYVDFWAKELFRSTGEKFDEQTLRDAFIRKMKLTPAPVSANPGAR